VNPLLNILLGLFLLACLAIGIVILRRPLIGRIALREAGRRPGQTAVLALGLMVAGAAIFSIQVIFDTMYESARAQVLQSLGHDDVEISGGGAYFDPGTAQRLANDSASCSCAAGFQNAVVTNGSVVDLDRLVGKPNVQVVGLDVAAEERFGSFVLTGGHSTLGDELGAGGVFLTQPLATALGAQTGDKLRVIAGGPTSHDVIVAGIVRREGAGAYGSDRSVFGSLGTVQMLAGADGVNVIRVSARGDGDTEVAAARRLAQSLQGALTANNLSLQALEVKRSALVLLDKHDENGRPFVTSFGVIIALAATALVANLAVMLSEERRPRFAVLRALGLTRTGLVQLSVTEGAIYSVLGAIAGLPAGYLLAFAIFHTPGHIDVPGAGTGLVFTVHITSLLGAVAGAALMNLVTVFLASLRTTRMAISSAIRDLPEPSLIKRPSRKRLAFMAALALAGVIAIVLGPPDLVLLGGALVIAAASGLLQGRVSNRARYSVAGAAAAAWAFFDFPLASSKVSSPGPFAYALLVSVVALSVLIATNLSVLDSLAGLVGRASARLRATLRPAMAYASRRPLRAGLVIAAFSIVMAILTLADGLLSAQLLNYRIDSGAWDVQAVVAGTDQLSVPDSLRTEVAKQAEFPSRTFFGPVNWEYADFQGTTGWHQEPVTIFGLSTQQLQSGMGFGNPSDWAAIARDPSLVASSNGGIGSVVHLATDQGTVTFRVAVLIPSTNGSGSTSILPGLIGSQRSLDRLGMAAPGAMMLLTAAPGTSAGTLAKNLQRALLTDGADVSTTRALLDQDYAASRGLVDFLILLMRIGLLVGISSLGAVALRAVIERRRSIGMLRAIGYQPAQVLAGMLTETSVVATAGIAVGLVVAYALGATLNTTLASGGRWSPDIGTLALTIALVYAAVLLVTLLPAIRAARLRPAEALRVLG
jgi:putative ABC transport system permease protein